jgi:hypothetical protein
MKVRTRAARVAALAGIAVAAVLGLSGCAKEIDATGAGAQSVPGASSLKFFCHGPMLIYYDDIEGSDDEVEGMWLGGCTFNPASHRWVFSTDPAVWANAQAGQSSDDTTPGNAQGNTGEEGGG